MRLVVADAGPLHYLVLTRDIEVLPRFFEKVMTPGSVRNELASHRAPDAVRSWIANPPPWLEIHPDPTRENFGDVMALDRGERAAIALAIVVKAELLLMDDQDGVTVARRLGLRVTGTLGVLDLAARQGFVDLAAAYDRLKATSFYYRQALLDDLLARHPKRGQD